METKSENKSLYFFKGIACFCVITLHFELPTKLGELFFVFARFAVPFFFMIAGYFSYFSDKSVADKTIRRRIHKLGRLTIAGMLLYFVINIVLQIKDGMLMEWVLSNPLSLKNLFYLLFCNWTTPFIGVGHLWYMLALLYVYLIYLVINKYDLHNVFYRLIPIVLLGVFVVEGLKCFSVISVPEIFYRNFLFTGLPFFMLGNAMNRYSESIKKMMIGKSGKRLVCLGFMTLLVFAEYILFHKSFNIYVSSLLLPLFFFAISITYPKACSNRFFVYIGKYCSADIYLYHYIFIIILNRYFSKFYYFYKLGAIWTFLLALLMSVILRELFKKREQRRCGLSG